MNEPSNEQRSLAAELAGYGFPLRDIAKHMQISLAELRANFKTQIESESYGVNIAVLRSLYQMATAGKNVTAATFIAKVRCGYREGSRGYDKGIGAPKKPPQKKLEDPGEPQVTPEFSVHCNDGEPNYR